MSDAMIAEGPIVNVSFPRSGHRYLREILARYFGPEFVFYESHQQSIVSADPAKCGLEDVNFIKTHDFDIEGHDVLRDKFPRSRRFLVQIRHPLESIASYYEFSLKHDARFSDNRIAWTVFLRTKLEYWKSFYGVWLRTGTKDQMVVEYNNLCARPMDTTAAVIRFLTLTDDVDQPLLEAAIKNQEFRRYVGGPASRQPVRRDIRDFKYFRRRRFEGIERRLAEDFLKPAGIPMLFSDSGI